MLIPENKTLVLFDGHCHLCSNTVQFILKHDRKKAFVFAPLQNEAGKEIRKSFRIQDDVDSVIVIDGGKAFYYSGSVFIIAKRLGNPWNLFLAFKIIPKVWADKLYRWIARNRFKWFGKRESCYLSPEDYSDRFL